MAYHYVQFGNFIRIPTEEQKTTFEKQIRDGTLITLPNGAYYNASRKTSLTPQEINISFVLARSTVEELYDAYAEWESALLEEQEAMLWRRPNSDNDESQSCPAKLKKISATPPIHKTTVFMRVTVTFILLRDRWQGSNILTVKQNFSISVSNQTLTFLIDRGKGNAEINNAKVIIKPGAGELTKVTLRPGNDSRAFIYEDRLLAGDTLKIDDGIDSIVKNFTQSAYAFTRQSFSATQEASSAWAPITKTGSLKVDLEGSSGASGYVKLSYYRAYA